MKITCPKCGHTAEVDDAVIPEGTTSVRCNACETRFPLVNMFEERMEQWEWEEECLQGVRAPHYTTNYHLWSSDPLGLSPYIGVKE